MFHPKYVILLILALLIVAWACNPVTPVNKAARDLSESLIKNDLSSAQRHANKVVSEDFDTSVSSVQDLCIIAISLMKLSEGVADGSDYAAQAIKFYEKALMKDSIGTQKYFEMLGPEDYNSAHLLVQLRNQIQLRECSTIDYDDEYEQ